MKKKIIPIVLASTVLMSSQVFANEDQSSYIGHNLDPNYQTSTLNGYPTFN